MWIKNRRLSIIFMFLLIMFLYLVFNYWHKKTSVSDRVDSFKVPPTELCMLPICTSQQIQQHGQLFVSMASDWSSCYADTYLLALEQHSTTNMNLIDVGTNKAYAVAAWLAFFLPELNINPARLGQYWMSTGKVTSSCGSCNDCQDEPLKKIHQQSLKLQIHAFEPQPDTVHLLNEVYQWMNVSGNNDLSLEIHGMAVSEYVSNDRSCLQQVQVICNATHEEKSFEHVLNHEKYMSNPKIFVL
jgi:hypothetical protein